MLVSGGQGNAGQSCFHKRIDLTRGRGRSDVTDSAERDLLTWFPATSRQPASRWYKQRHDGQSAYR